MGYMDNSYSNSNNGGSVNSQDSIWQMKMAAGNSANLVPAHNFVDRQPSYGYDPLTHGGYGTVDDYAPYPHLATPSQHGGDDYHTMRNSQNPSRQEYCGGDPYAAVHKPKKRLDQHLGEFFLSLSSSGQTKKKGILVDISSDLHPGILIATLKQIPFILSLIYILKIVEASQIPASDAWIILEK